jgi:hypothetical protein
MLNQKSDADNEPRMQMKPQRKTSLAAAFLFAWVAILAPPTVRAQDSATVSLSIKNHAFQPGQIHGPANKSITIRIKNLDATAMEFESIALRVEKVVAPNSEGVINIRPLAPGNYEFFDDLHAETRGTLVVQ